MKILVIISRDLEKGSTKYRFVQYLGFLKSKGIEVEFVKRDSINAAFIKRLGHFDLIFNQKCLFRSSLARGMITRGPRIIFDFDDAVYTRPGKPHSLLTEYRVKKRLHLWLRCSDMVTTSNNFLAGYASNYSKRITIIPMALDLDVWKPGGKKMRDIIVIGWAGAPVNLPLIEKLDSILISLLKKYDFLRLAIFSGRRPRLNCPFDYYPFYPGREPAFMQDLDIGLLPLIDEEYSLGKSPIKAIQYLACGVPVVGNVIGATGEILNDKNSLAVSTPTDWINSIEKLIKNRALARLMGQEGRKYVQENHDANLISELFFNTLMGGVIW